MDGAFCIDREDIAMEFLEYFKLRWTSDLTMVGAYDIVWSTNEERTYLEDNAELCRHAIIDKIEVVL